MQLRAAGCKLANGEFTVKFTSFLRQTRERGKYLRAFFRAFSGIENALL
jgi:hypothetical protein